MDGFCTTGEGRHGYEIVLEEEGKGAFSKEKGGYGLGFGLSIIVKTIDTFSRLSYNVTYTTYIV